MAIEGAFSPGCFGALDVGTYLCHNRRSERDVRYLHSGLVDADPARKGAKRGLYEVTVHLRYRDQSSVLAGCDSILLTMSTCSLWQLIECQCTGILGA